MNPNEIELTATVAMQAVLIKWLLTSAKYEDFIAGFNEEGPELIRQANTSIPPNQKLAAALEAAFHKLGAKVAP